jgi:hypothetical protein
MAYKQNRKLHRDLGSLLNGLITLSVLVIVFKILGDISIINKAIISLIAAGIAYPLVGLILRGIGVWKY